MKVLLIDDDRDHIAILRFAFEMDHYQVITAFDGEKACDVFERELPDLVVLDMNLPRRSGIEVLRHIRQSSSVPIIILSVMGESDKIINALDLGADDYVLKPFNPTELRARARALCRRSQDHERTPTPTPLVLNNLRLDPRRREVIVDGRSVNLTRTEFDLLHYLILNHNIVLTEAAILANVWGYPGEETDETVRVTIYRLRHKIELNPSNPKYIINVPGVGYMFQS